MSSSMIMRDVFIGELCRRMQRDKNIFFLSADFGSPRLDVMREKFKDRFVNVGIAEQNLVNVATGLALEGFAVYAYAIAPFLAMRAYEQIRVHLSLLAQLKDVNVNLIGVGAGLSYDVSGPTHHCLEDISIMRALPHLTVFSPSDAVLTKNFVDYSLRIKGPKYLRLDGKPLPDLYREDIALEAGFKEIRRGRDVCLVSTGYMTHQALKVAEILGSEGIRAGVIDVFLLNPVRGSAVFRALKRYDAVMTLEEGFVGRGGLDSLIATILDGKNPSLRFQRMGFSSRHVFDIGTREYLHGLHRLDVASLVKAAKRILRKRR